MLWLKTAVLFIAGISNILVALAVLARGTKNITNISFFALSVAMAGWTIGIAFFMLTNEPNLAFVWAKIYYLFPLLAAVALAFFVQSFPNRLNFSLKWVVPLLAGFLIVVLPLLLVSDFITETLIYHSWGKEIVLDKFEYLLYSIYLLVCFPLCLLRIYHVSKRERGVYSAQAELFFVGFLIACVFGVFFNLILPWAGNYHLIWIGPLFTSAFIIATAYSIVRHRMFNIRLIVARSVGYLLAVGLLVIAYALMAFVLITTIVFKESNIPITQILAFTILAVFLAFTFHPALQFFNKITNKVFYRDAYDPQAFIDELNRVLATTINLNKLLTESSRVIGNNLKAEFCQFILHKTAFMDERVVGDSENKIAGRELESLRHLTAQLPTVIVVDYLNQQHSELRKLLIKNDVAVLVRIAPATGIVHEGVGYIVVGQKRSGNLYGDQDAKILDIISRELLVAIQNALHVEEIERFNTTLQEKIEEATRQLRRTNDKLRKLDETKDDFISMASHQLRTPLTSVKGYVSMVLDNDAGKITPLQRKLLTQAFISSQRMVYLISDLLNVSRLRTGKFIIEPVPTNLAKVIEEEVEQLVETAKGRQLELTYNKPEHFPTLPLDETKLRQVIMNFIDNAVYYTPAGGHITVNLVDKPKTIEFTVTDDGIGVPKHDQHHLFSKFFRAHNAKRARPDGTGLGLFMAKKVIIAQGGAVLFRSEEHRGSTFGFTFAKDKLQGQIVTPDHR